MEALKICKNFIQDVLSKEKWFQKMIECNDCDLLLLVGTSVRNFKDLFSDIDIFIVCGYKAQIRHMLKPVKIYNYDGAKIELSAVSTEKLFNDIYTKENLHWWHKAKIIKSFNNEAKKALRKASTLSKKEFLDRIWTDFASFEINSFNMEKQMKRNEPLSVRLLFFENVKFAIDALLADSGEYHHSKGFGFALKQINKKVYDDILKIQEIKDFNNIRSFNTKIRKDIIGVLENNGFTKKEIEKWGECNLKRLIFQYK